MKRSFSLALFKNRLNSQGALHFAFSGLPRWRCDDHERWGDDHGEDGRAAPRRQTHGAAQQVPGQRNWRWHHGGCRLVETFQCVLVKY